MPKKTPSTSKPIQALLEVTKLPAAFYGTGRARITRKLFHVCLASRANPDGTSIFPSQDTLAEQCAGISVYEAHQLADWLEYEAPHSLVRKLPDLHPVYRTNQYTLLLPPPEAIGAAKAESKARIAKKREKTRLRTAKWRAKQRQEREAVTQQNGVTDSPGDATSQGAVTQHQRVGDTTFLIGDATIPIGDATIPIGDAENPPFSVSTASIRPPVLDRQSEPPAVPPINSDRGKDGALAHSESRTSADLVEQWASWMSDLVYACTDARNVPSKRDMEELGSIVAETDPALIAIAFYKFCNRPMGIHGLRDVFGMLWREWPNHRKDAERELQSATEDGYSVREILEGLHSDQFTFEDLAREKERSLPSMRVLATVLELTKQVCTENV